MFEAYSNKTKNAFLIARVEAIRNSRSAVEVEDFVVGLLRADTRLSLRLFGSQLRLDEFRSLICQIVPTPSEPRLSVSVDLPPSPQCKRVISFASAESGRLKRKSISPEHIFLGVLKENGSKASSLLISFGVTANQLEEEESSSAGGEPVTALPQIPRVRDLVSEVPAKGGEDLIGRKRELDSIIQILSRRNRNSPILIGEPGVGKDRIVRGLVRNIAEDNVPSNLLDRHILMVDASDLAEALGSDSQLASRDQSSLQKKLFEIGRYGGPILYIRGLFDIRANFSLLANYLKSGKLQIITSGASNSFRLALERNEELARHFEVVAVLPPTESESAEVIGGMKHEFEDFHGVVISAEAVTTAIRASGQFLRDRTLPESALDLLDDAAALVKLRCDAVPPQLSAIQRKMHALLRRADTANADGKFELAQQLHMQERQEREAFNALRTELDAESPSNAVTADDVAEAIALRIPASLESVQAALARGPVTPFQEEIRASLCTGIPVGMRDWVDGLLAYLSVCSTDDADRLIQRIRSAKLTLDAGTSS